MYIYIDNIVNSATLLCAIGDLLQKTTAIITINITITITIITTTLEHVQRMCTHPFIPL